MIALEWSPWAVPGLLAAVLALALAPLVYGTGGGRRLNRLLWFLLVADAADVLFSYAVLLPMVADPATIRAAALTNLVADVWSVAAYLLFVGAALATPLVRPLAAPAGRAVVVVGAVVMTAAVLLLPTAFVVDAYPLDHWFFRSAWDPGVAASTFWMFAFAAFTFGLVAAIDAYRRASQPLARRQARAYLLALGTRDVAWAATFGSSAVLYLVLGVAGADAQLAVSDVNAYAALLYASGLLVYVPLLAYGFFSARLFDIDLRVKWTISRGTLAAMFLAVFFVVATVASEFLTGTLGYALGGVAAGLLLFFLAPLQRLAERLSDRAMPGVRDTEEYRTVRKREVYAAAVESALQDGAVTDKERDILATMAEQLGLGPVEARAIERDVQAKGAA